VKGSAGVPWQVTIFEIDKAGTLVGDPHGFACTATGCEEALTLDISGKPFRFLVELTFVPKGAYFALQSMQPEISSVVAFEEGFVGPTFLQVRAGTVFNTTLRFTLTGTAMAETEQQGAQLMPNARSLVFHRRMVPDLTLRLALAPAPAPAPKP
jgi:hypothetical protein